MFFNRLDSGRRNRVFAAILSIVTCLVLLLTAALPAMAAPTQEGDPNLPTVEKFTIANQDVLSAPSVVLHTQATAHAAGAALQTMYIREWAISHDGTQANWVVVHNSGWIPYQADLAWVLGSQPGVHYLAVAVADNQNHVSQYTKAAADYANLVQPNTPLPLHGMVVYLVSYAQGTPVHVETTASAGTPWMFTWYPGNTQAPNKWNLSAGTQTEFTAPMDGTYLFVVYAPDALTYTTSITPTGGPNILETVIVVDSPPPADTNGTYSSRPLAYMSPMEAGATMPTALTSYSVFIPVLRH